MKEIKKKATTFQTPHKAKRSNNAKLTGKKQALITSGVAQKGKLGTLLGHSVVSVIRAMGKAGWDYETTRAALEKARIKAAPHTVKVGLKRGKDGQKRIAALSKAQLETLRLKK